MPMHKSPNIDTDSNHTKAMLPQTSPITNQLSSATQSDILGILQREQDRAMSLLSSSPLLASLFVSYANQVATLESAAATPSPESEEWKALQDTITTLQEEVERLKSENGEMAKGMQAAEASQEAFQSQVLSLKEVNTIQQEDIDSLRAELVEAKEKYARLTVESNTEKAALQIQVSDLETQRVELKETIVDQQVRISRLERQGTASSLNLPIAAMSAKATDTRELDTLGGINTDDGSTRGTQSKEPMEQDTMEARRQKAAKKRLDRAARESAESAKRKEWEGKRIREGEEEETGQKSEETDDKKASASKIPSTWSRTIAKDEWDSAGNFASAKKESSGLPLVVTPRVLAGKFDGIGKFDFSVRKKDSTDGIEEPCTSLTKEGKKRVDNLSNLSKVATPMEPLGFGKLDILEDSNIDNMSAKVSTSENECFTDTEQESSPIEFTSPNLVPKTAPKVLLSTTPELLKTPKEETSTTPEPRPAPSLNPAQAQVPMPTPVPAKTEPEKPLSFWGRKKLKAAAPASSLFGGGDKVNSPSVWGETAGGGGNTESIVMPTLDRQSIFADTARDQKRENQRENLVEGFLGSDSARRRNDSAQSQVTAKPTTKPAPAPTSVPQKSGGWGSWGDSLLNNISSAIATERSPSPELPPAMLKVEDPPRGFTPSQPPKSQPAGFGSLNKPAWSAGDSVWGAAKTGPAPIAQKTSTGPAWGAKPMGSTFSHGGTAWGSSPNTAGPENIPELAVEIKHAPASGSFNSSITDKGEETGDAQDDGWEREETKANGSKKSFKVPSPVQEKPSETPAEETEEPVKGEVDWTNIMTTKMKGQVASVARTPATPNTPNLENAGDGAGGPRKKKRGGKR